jgi:hypothetical protein
MNRALVVLAVSTFLVAATATPAQAATKASSRLVGPDASLTCARVDHAEDGEDINERGPGKVTMKVKNGKITATVKLERAQRNANYDVRIIQGQPDCHTSDGTLRTNRRGNGTLTHAEPVTGHAAQVMLSVDADPTTGAGTYWRAKKALCFNGWEPYPVGCTGGPTL